MDNNLYSKFLRDKYAALRDHKILFSFILIAIILFSVYLISAASFIVSIDTASINEDILALTTVNFTINNSQTSQNITNLTIMLPRGFGFNATSNGSTPNLAGITGSANFSYEGNNLSWINVTDGLINSSVNRSFWIDINQSAPGTYNITVNISYANSSTDSYNLTLVVNDTTAPAITINLQNNSNLTGAADYFNVTILDASLNFSGVFAALKNSTGYYNLSGELIVPGDFTNWTNLPGFNSTRYSNNITSNNFADGTYYLYVNATDNASNNGTAPIINITIDNTDPVITINLQNNSNLTGAADGFNATVIDTNKNFTGVFAALKNTTGYYNLSGSIISGGDYTNWTNLPSFNATRYSNNITSDNFADGPYYLYVNATDYLSNNATAARINITIDNTAPTAFNLVQPLNETISTNRTPTLKWEPTAEFNFLNYTIQIDDDPAFGSILNTTGTYLNTTNKTGVTETTLAADATYYWRVTAWDDAGNSVVTPKFTYITDNTAPAVTINLQNNSNLTAAEDYFNVTVTDANKNYTGVFAALKNTTGYYNLSGSVIPAGSDYNNWTNLPSFNATRYSNNITSNNFADGTYYLYVNATDNASNNGTAPIINITIDNTNPVITINLQNNSNLTGAADGFNATVIDTNKNFTGVFAALKNSTGYYRLSGSVISGGDYTNWTNLPSFNATRYSNNITSDNFADGSYLLYVNASDYLWNNATAPTINLTIDNTNPTSFSLVQPENITVSTNRTPTLKWEPTADLTFVNYTMQIDDDPAFGSILNTTGTYANSANKTGVTETTLAADATYYWRVTAWDELGQSYTTPKFIYITDNTAPAVTVNNWTAGNFLKNNSNLTGAADYFNVSVIDTNKNLTGVFATLHNTTGYYSLAGVVITAGSDYNNWTNLPSFNATRYSNNITSNNFADGNYLLYVNATDNATNTGTAPTINITIDNTNPVITIINLQNNSNLTGAADGFNVTVVENNTNFTGVFAALKNSTGYYSLSGSRIATGEFTNWTNLPKFNSSSYSSIYTNNITSDNFADGSYKLYVNASDYLWNNGTAPIINITIDNTAPNATFISPANATSTTTALQMFQCNASDPLEVRNITFYLYDSTSALVNITVNDTSRVSPQVNFSYTLPHPGTFFWNCRANDTLNNTGWAGSNRTIILDATPAVESSSSGVGGAAQGTTYDSGVLTASITKDLKMGDTAKFTIEGTSHTIKILGFTASTASVQIKSVTITKLLKIGEPELVDLDNDGINELSLKLESISLSSLKVNITITPLVGAVAPPAQPETNVTPSETPPAEEPQPPAAAPPETTPPASTTKEKPPVNTGLVTAILLVSVVAIIIGIILLKKSKKPIWQLWS